MLRERRKQKEACVLEPVGKKKRQGITRWQFRRLVSSACWLLFLAAFTWSIYRSLTVTDKVTVKEKERVELRNDDTSGLESFVKNFAVAYFSYSPGDAAQRNELLYSYMPEELIGMLPVNAAETPVSVTGVQIWDIVSGNGEGGHKVKFTVIRKAGDGAPYTGAYCVGVTGKGGDYAITGLPYITSMPKKADYKIQEAVQAELADVGMKEEVSEFLDTFFKIYPVSTEEELKYYLKDSKIDKIERDLELESVDNIMITGQEGGIVEVRCMVVYTDNLTGLSEASQYALTLEAQEDGKYIITALR